MSGSPGRFHEMSEHFAVGIALPVQIRPQFFDRDAAGTIDFDLLGPFWRNGLPGDPLRDAALGNAEACSPGFLGERVSTQEFGYVHSAEH